MDSGGTGGDSCIWGMVNAGSAFCRQSCMCLSTSAASRKSYCIKEAGGEAVLSHGISSDAKTAPPSLEPGIALRESPLSECEVSYKAQ